MIIQQYFDMIKKDLSFVPTEIQHVLSNACFLSIGSIHFIKYYDILYNIYPIKKKNSINIKISP